MADVLSTVEKPASGRVRNKKCHRHSAVRNLFAKVIHRLVRDQCAASAIRFRGIQECRRHGLDLITSGQRGKDHTQYPLRVNATVQFDRAWRHQRRLGTRAWSWFSDHDVIWFTSAVRRALHSVIYAGELPIRRPKLLTIAYRKTGRHRRLRPAGGDGGCRERWSDRAA
jgi:hypothetical protein